MNPSPQIPQSEARAALEDITHLSRKICAIWASPELDSFLSKLIMDARDGARQGLPVPVAAEILFLAKTNKIVRAMDLSRTLKVNYDRAFTMVDEGDEARLRIDPLDDPLVSRDTITRIDRTAATAARSTAPRAASQAHGLGQLLLMLIRSKWLVWTIILILGIKFLWPLVKSLI